MQFAKDSFSMALRERLAALNADRTVTVNGAKRPAVVVLENELANPAELQCECFYLSWGGVKVVNGASGHESVCALECAIEYRTRGSVESGVDRGRVLGELDRELCMICQPGYAGKRDFSQAPIANLGTGLFWSRPVIEAVDRGSSPSHDAGLAEHRAKVTVFFFPEVESL